MSGGFQNQCAVCAWRGTCQKKHGQAGAALHCPEYCRDTSLPAEEPEGQGRERHKRVEDVFSSRK